MQAFNAEEYGGALLPDAIIGDWAGNSINCESGYCDAAAAAEYYTELNLHNVSMDFEEPAGTLFHSYYDEDPTADTRAVLYFRRMDTCDYWDYVNGRPGTEFTGEGQKGPQPLDTTADSQCYVFRACYETFFARFADDYSHFSNEIAVSIQSDGSLWWTYVSCYQPSLLPEEGPGLITARAQLYRPEACPGETPAACIATCPESVADAFDLCARQCVERCQNLTDAEGDGSDLLFLGLTGAAIIGIFVAPIAATALIVVAAWGYNAGWLHIIGFPKAPNDPPLLPPREPTAPSLDEKRSVESIEMSRSHTSLSHDKMRCGGTASV
jgi:hypothetical protein